MATEIDEEVQKILEAVKAGNYKVSYEEPNCFSERTKPNGDTFYVIRDDDVHFGCDYGSTTVTVGGYSFRWNPVEDEWDISDNLNDKDGLIAEALNNREDIVRLSSSADADDLISFYELATGSSIEAYYYEDSECPVDAEDVVSPDSIAVDTVTYKRKTYYLIDDPEEEEGYDDRPVFKATAIAEDAEPDDQGIYECVTIYFKAIGSDGCYDVGRPFDVDDSPYTYDGINECLN